MIGTVHLLCPDKNQHIDFQQRNKIGIALESLLAYPGTPGTNKKLNKHKKIIFMKTQFHELLNKSIMKASKRSILFIALALVLCTTYSFAAPTDNANAEVRASFQKDFRDARLMTTEVHKDFTKLTFSMNDEILYAFYTQDGSLLAVTRNITSSQLPVNLLLNLQKQMNNRWITELFEFNSDEQHCYYVSLQNADGVVNLRSNGQNWEVFSTSKN